jgi:hypothetical protein
MLRAKSGHQCGGGIRGNKERASKVLYVYLAWRVDRWKTEEHMRVNPHACAVMPWGGGVLGLAWDVAVMMPLQCLGIHF